MGVKLSLLDATDTGEAIRFARQSGTWERGSYGGPAGGCDFR